MLHEITRRCINVSKHDDTIFKQHNCLLALRGDKQLHILEYSYNVLCLDKKLDFVESSIVCPRSSATSEFSKEYARKGISNIELVEFVTNPYFWPYSNDLKQEMTNIIAFEWSPSDLIYNNQSVLAILNSVGNVEFFGPQQKVWCSIVEFSDIMKHYFISELQIDVGEKCKTIEKLKEVVYGIGTSAICWGPSINEDRSSIFVTAQRNSTIIFWSIKFTNTDLSVDVLGKIYADVEEIKTLAWIPYSENLFLLIYANVLGEVVGKVCRIEEGKILEQVTIVLWKCKDRMVPKNIQYIIDDNCLLIIYPKHRHLVVQMFDTDFKLLTEVVNVVNDEKISVLTKTSAGLYIGTINTKIYKLIYTLTRNALTIEFESIILKDSYVNHDLYGLAFSPNEIICHLVLANRRVNVRKEPLHMLVVSLSSEEQIENVLLDNPSKKLTHMWDCIELLRYKTMKSKKLPSLDYVNLYNETNTDIYKLKVYLILVKLYNSLEEILKNQSKGLLPETSIEVVQDKLLAAHAKETIINKYEQHKNPTLNGFEKEWLSGCCKYLEYYSKKYEIPKNNIISNNTWESLIALITKTELPKYNCLFCDDLIEDFACANGHTSMFCSVTFTPIDSEEYLACNCCEVTARMELYQYKPLCVLCDGHLESYNVSL
ncbi:unnamed protein product [Pieris brassicae]|uniref:Transcription factor IIIC 90kDa subunit N-terminal domain-containing protein n=1 Tax=Pieris brassicae TaxID=7116 RepID=A0A9P0XD28_PIEBR|nr:unnamed protein product [Pieris brassicae]